MFATMFRFRRIVAVAVALACACMAAAQAAPRAVTALDEGWEFAKGAPVGWTAVTLPHTFNADDGTAPHPYRGAGWYRRTIVAPAAKAGRTYLEFDGAALSADVWLNGTRVGRHEGGFARFRFDVTDLLRAGANELRVRVDNARQPDVAPLGGDYTLYGGLYRKVRLVTTSDVHVDMLDAGGPGVYFSTPKAERPHWRVRVANDRARAENVVVTARLRDAAGKVAATAQRSVALPARAVVPVELTKSGSDRMREST